VIVVRDEHGRLHALVINDKKTSLEVNEDGFLERLAPPGREPWRMVYNKGGLLKEILP
jgi:hypothetical protein